MVPESTTPLDLTTRSTILESKSGGITTFGSEASVSLEGEDKWEDAWDCGEGIQSGSRSTTPTRQRNAYLARYSHVRHAVNGKWVKDTSRSLEGISVEWMCCGCRTYNFTDRKTCRRCKQRDVESFKHNSPPSRHIPLFPSPWLCHLCGNTNELNGCEATNRNKFFCTSCGGQFPGIREWYCPSCCHINSRGSTQCATCYVGRPLSWTCAGCSHDKNSVFFTECRICHQVRRKLVSDSTVLCPTCYQRNDVQWEMCFLCMAPLGMMASVRRMQIRVQKTHLTSTKALNPEISAAEQVEGGVTLAACKPSGKDTASNHPPEMPSGGICSASEDAVSPAVGSAEGDDAVAKMLPVETDASALKGKEEEEMHIDPGAWICAECHVFQRRNVGFCDICLKPRVIVDPGRSAKRQEATVLYTTWTCHSCLHHNEDLTAIACAKCTEPRSQGSKEDHKLAEDASAGTVDGKPFPSSSKSVVALAAVNTLETGRWRCPYCRSFVDVMVTSCCGSVRETPFGYWRCSSCCSTNRDERVRCLGCGAASATVKPWRCFGCRRRNGADIYQCDYCGSGHPRHWKCMNCGSCCQRSEGEFCKMCGGRKTKQEVLSCLQCSAQNHPKRKSCFRCHARLSSDTWNCGSCGHRDNEKQLRRCCSCGEPRQYNMDEFTWICDVCSTNVASGGELKVRTQCPRCNAECSENSMRLPSRWKCRLCGVSNACSVPYCTDCGNKRLLENLCTHTSCSSCFRLTTLNEKETCEHCNASLSQIINDVGSLVSLSSYSTLLDKVTGDTTVEKDEPVAGQAAPTSSNSLFPCLVPAHGSAERFADAHVLDSASDPVFLSNALGMAGSQESFPVASVNNVEVADNPALLCDVATEDKEARLCCGSEEEVAEEWEEEELTVDVLKEDELPETIPSWICGNCETKNPGEELLCVNCHIERGDN
ncbi:hypothetical protein TRVL_03212 [Trypanosoma vivax]|nr:hypothetical protein TRVL_03212 [Trypanosoma vivax]